MTPWINLYLYFVLGARVFRLGSLALVFGLWTWIFSLHFGPWTLDLGPVSVVRRQSSVAMP